MIKIENTDYKEQYLLRDNFTTMMEDEIELSSNDDASIFFNVEDLFKEGMTEEDFIKKYEEIVAPKVFNLEKNENSETIDLSSISKEDLEDIEEIAKKYFESIDDDGNGVISKEELDEIASSDGDSETISDDDIKALTAKLFLKDRALELGQNEINDTDETTEASNNVHHSGGGGGGGGSIHDTSNQLSSAEKSATLEELEQKRKEKQTELDGARTNMQSIYTENDKDINAAKEKYEETLEKDENISKELKDEQKQVLNDCLAQETEINSLKSELVKVDGNIANYQSTINAKDSEIAALNSALSELNSSKTDSEELQSKAKENRSEIQRKIVQAENDKKAAQQQLDSATEKKAEIEQSISEKEAKLESLNTKKAEVEAKITNLASEETKAALLEYQNVKTQADSKVKEAQNNISSIQKEIGELDKQINEKKSNKIKADYRLTKLNKTYNLNGQEFMSLLSQNELDNFLRNEWQQGNYNKNSNCLSMATLYCKDIMNMLHLSGSAQTIKSDNQEDIEKSARECLDNGYPATLHVSTKAGTRHYATAVGYRITDDGKIVFLLADNVQGVGITACGEGQRRHLITGYSTPYKNQNYGYLCINYNG